LRYLFTVWSFPGCLHPFLSVGKALQQRGHEIAYYTGSAYRQVIEQEGFTFFPFQSGMDEVVQRCVFSENSIGANWNRPWRVPALLKVMFVDTIPMQLEDLEDIVQNWKPRAIVCDPALFAPFLILHERSRIPVVLLSYVLGCLYPGPDIPPVGLGLPLPRGPLSRLRNFLVGKTVDLSLYRFRRGANSYRRRYGLVPVRGSVVTLASKLPLYLITSCPDLDYPRSRLPSNVRYVGACFWYPPQQPQRWIEALPQDRPCVYVNEGTIHVAKPFILQTAREGLADRPMQVIMTTGLHRDAASLGIDPVPANFIIHRWVNHDGLMPRVNVMVCTGGPGTILAALKCGVPMVVIPTEWDHPENAERLREAGVAIRLSQSECTPRRLRKAVEKLIHEPSYRRNARRISSTLRLQGGAERAAELVERI